MKADPDPSVLRVVHSQLLTLCLLHGIQPACSLLSNNALLFVFLYYVHAYLNSPLPGKTLSIQPIPRHSPKNSVRNVLSSVHRELLRLQGLTPLAPHSLLKTLCSPFDKLRTNGRGAEIIESFRSAELVEA